MKTLNVKLKDWEHCGRYIRVKTKHPKGTRWITLGIFFDEAEANLFVNKLKDQDPSLMLRVYREDF